MRPTHRPSRSRRYGRAGGPWDGAALDPCLELRGAGADRLVDGDVRLSGEAIAARVSALAGSLRSRGVRRRDAVAWQLPNWHEAVLLYRACWRLGAVAAPLHHGFGEAEVGHALGLLRPRLVLAAPGLPAAHARGAVGVRGDTDGFRGLLEEGRPVGRNAGRPPDLAVVLFTSGSTGKPKAVLHTQRGLAYKARLMAQVHGLSGQDCVLMPAPLAHVSGLLNAVLVPGAAGMRTVLMARWDPEAALAAITGERVTFMVGPPTFFVGLMGAPRFSPERVRSLRLVSSGGAGVSPAFVAAATEQLGCRVKRTYGSTEAPTVTTTTAADPVEQARETDGRAVGEVELRVSDPGSGRALAPGLQGELWVRGPEVFVGYAGHDDGSEDYTDPNRHTGKLDRVRVDDSGALAVQRLDLVNSSTAQFWHNRTVQRLVYDRAHKELYVGTNHGIDRLEPDRYRDPKAGEWFLNVTHEWLSDHLHPRVCFHAACTGDESKDDQRMGDWRGIAYDNLQVRAYDSDSAAPGLSRAL